MKRGSLIVIEGIDRTGKSTQCKALVENLKLNHLKAEYMNFPNRQSDIGKVINSYLTSQIEFPDEAIHLLFSANRWESSSKMIKKLYSGTNLIVDRYSYSGVAFSAAKGLDINWCKKPEIGLPLPDKVFFLTLPLDDITARDGFGNERYEVLDFQRKVSFMYSHLRENDWEVFDASRSIDDIQKELLKRSLEVINDAESLPIGKLWTNK